MTGVQTCALPISQSSQNKGTSHLELQKARELRDQREETCLKGFKLCEQRHDNAGMASDIITGARMVPGEASAQEKAEAGSAMARAEQMEAKAKAKAQQEKPEVVARDYIAEALADIESGKAAAASSPVKEEKPMPKPTHDATLDAMIKGLGFKIDKETLDRLSPARARAGRSVAPIGGAARLVSEQQLDDADAVTAATLKAMGLPAVVLPAVLHGSALKEQKADAPKMAASSECHQQLGDRKSVV